MKSIEKRIARWCEVQTLTRPRCKFVYVMVAYLGGLRLLQPGGRHMQWTPPDQKLGALEVAVQTVLGEVRVRQDGKHRAWQVPAGVRLDIADAEGVHTVIGPDSANMVNNHSADGVSRTEK